MKKNIIIVLAITFLLILSFAIGWLARTPEINRGQDNILALRDTVRTYEITIDSLKKTVFEKSALILTQNEAIEAGIIQKEQLKKTNIKLVATNTDLKGEIRLLKDSISLLEQNVHFVYVSDSMGSFNAVKLPYSWNYSDKYVNFSTGIGENKLGHFSLSLPLDLTVTSGYDKKGVAKSVVVTPNPYIYIRDINTTIIASPKKWYQQWWVTGLMGFTAGVLFNSAIH